MRKKYVLIKTYDNKTKDRYLLPFVKSIGLKLYNDKLILFLFIIKILYERKHYYAYLYLKNKK